MDAMFTSVGGKKATELIARRAESEDEARTRFELDGYTIPPEAAFIQLDNGQKAFVMPGHPKHPDFKEEEVVVDKHDD